jgi:2-oxoglutarate dehydrogenase complex dehydrogenase (E1) component-like enzyme
VLRHSGAISKIEEMGPGSSFQPILPYKNNDNLHQCKVVFLTSGKFVYEIQELIVAKKSSNTCLFAIEELYPFPETQL